VSKQRQRREYLRLLDSAVAAIELSIDCFNRVQNSYRDESTLILMTNAWELLAKSVLLKSKKSIAADRRGNTISSEVAVYRLVGEKALTQAQADTVQQIISLRNQATHGTLTPVPEEVMHHLLFYGCKFFKEVLNKQFPSHGKLMTANHLSLSLGEMTTYADRVQKSVAQMKRSQDDFDLIWLLERGISFDGKSYITKKQVEAKFKGKYKILPHLAVGDFIRTADMVRIVPVEAPKNFTADVVLRKGKGTNSSLPVVFKKTDIEDDYPYLTKELGDKLGKNQSWTARAISALKMKGDTRYHQPVRSGSRGHIHRYSEAAFDRLHQEINGPSKFNPYSK